jgi:phosphorylcholine metabolism protein LicD
MMHRSEYLKFEKVCTELLVSNGFFLQTNKTDPYYTWFLPRVIYLNSHLEKSVALSPKAKSGVALDIFIIDAVPEGEIKYKAWMLMISLFRGMAKRNIDISKYPTFSQKTMIIVSGSLGRMVSATVLHALYIKIINVVDSKTDVIGMMNNCHKNRKNKYRKKYFESSIDAEFDGLKVPIPVGYEIYLTKLYGSDWMAPPPKHLQIPHEVNSLFVEYNDKVWRF